MRMIYYRNRLLSTNYYYEGTLVLESYSNSNIAAACAFEPWQLFFDTKMAVGKCI